MAGDVGSYRELPRLRAELGRLRAAGKAGKAGELARRVMALEREAKRAAGEVVTERKQLKRRFELLAGEIRDIRATGTASEETRLRLRRLQVEARRLQDRHAEVNERVRAFRWYLTGVQGDGSADTPGESPTAGPTTSSGARATDSPPRPTRQRPATADAAGSHAGGGRAGARGDEDAEPPRAAPVTDAAVASRRGASDATADAAGSRPGRVGGRWSRRVPPTGFAPTTAARGPALPVAIAAAAGVVVLLAGALFGATRLVNARLVAQVEPIVERALAEAGAADIVRYERVTVSALAGEIGLTGVVAEDPASGTRIAAERVTLRAPRLELLRARTQLATPGAALPPFTRIDLRATNAELGGPGASAGTLGAARLLLEGQVSPDLLAAPPETQLAALRRAALTLTNLDVPAAGAALSATGSFRWLSDPATLTHLDDLALDVRHDPENRRLAIERYLLRSPLVEQNASALVTYRLGRGERVEPASVALDFETSTTYTADAFALGDPDLGTQLLSDLPALTIAADLSFDYAETGNAVNPASLIGALAVTAGPMSIALPDQAAPALGGLIPTIGDTLRLERLVVDASIPEAGVVEIGEIAVASSLVTMAMSGGGALDLANGVAPGTLTLDGTVDHLPDSLREQLGVFASSMGAALPANGAFSFAFTLDERGTPTLSIE